VPPWSQPDAKDPTKPESKFATFNARSEEVEEKATLPWCLEGKAALHNPHLGVF
jgi:hypothetical protein